MKDTMGHFTLEVIGACAFGIKCDALTDENAHFVKVCSNQKFFILINMYLYYVQDTF